MANVDKVIKDLVINEMSQEEFDAQKAAGTIVPNEIYVTPDKTDDKLDKKVSVVQGEENAGKVLVVNEDGEVVPDKPKVGASLPILTHVFADHELNDISWLNADTFSWQSGDVYVAAYEHLREEFVSGEIKNETIAGITITYKQAEDGHKICTAQQEANVQALYEKTGVAWYYILDIENKRFKLPRTKHAFTGLRDSVGKYVPAGLPNIEGRFGSYLANVGSLGVNTATGAFSGTSKQNLPTATKTGTETATQNTLINFNANYSSSVYGNSTTVQPPATQMYLYFYVGNFERDAVEQTAGINAELFSNKADSNLKNTPLQVESTGKILVSNQLFAQSTNNRELRLQVGDDVNNGSLLALYGQESTQGTAGFLLRACLEEGKYNDLVGRTDGNLSWKGERISCLESEQLPTIDSGYLWYKVYDDGFVIQGGRCIGTWEIEAGQEQVPYVTMAIPMNTTHTFPFFTCKELYCLPMGWYMANSTTLRPRFGSYTAKRTLTQFDWVVFGRKA